MFGCDLFCCQVPNKTSAIYWDFLPPSESQIHFSQLFLLLKLFGDEIGGDISSGYGYLSDEEEQGDTRLLYSSPKPTFFCFWSDKPVSSSRVCKLWCWIEIAWATLVDCPTRWSLWYSINQSIKYKIFFLRMMASLRFTFQAMEALTTKPTTQSMPLLRCRIRSSFYFHLFEY